MADLNPPPGPAEVATQSTLSKLGPGILMIWLVLILYGAVTTAIILLRKPSEPPPPPPPAEVATCPPPPTAVASCPTPTTNHPLVDTAPQLTVGVSANREKVAGALNGQLYDSASVEAKGALGFSYIVKQREVASLTENYPPNLYIRLSPHDQALDVDNVFLQLDTGEQIHTGALGVMRVQQQWIQRGVATHNVKDDTELKRVPKGSFFEAIELIAGPATEVEGSGGLFEVTFLPRTRMTFRFSLVGKKAGAQLFSYPITIINGRSSLE